MRQIKIYRYKIPFNQKMGSGIVLRSQNQELLITSRQGLIVELTENNNVGLGEIAPLYLFSDESLADAQSQLIEIANNWHLKKTPDKINFDDLYPSVAFGFSVAMEELSNKLIELPDDYHHKTAKLNNCTNVEIDELINDNVGLVKIKIGRDKPKNEAKLINKLVEKKPKIKIRLDANRLLNIISAMEFQQELYFQTINQIEFIEEPCSDFLQNLEFVDKTKCKIAWDESLIEAINENDLSKLIHKNVGAFIIKPALIGSLEKCCQIIDFAKQNDVDSVISSLIESNVSLLQLAKIAKQHTPKMVPGLDTHTMFTDDINLHELTLIWQA